MIGQLLGLFTSALDPVSRLIDSVHTSEPERLDARRKLLEVQTELVSLASTYETELARSRSRIIESEAKGQGVLQRNWRPITMLTFLVLVVCDAFGWLPFRLAEQAWTLLQIGLGGYVVGRSLEKVAPAIMGGKDR